MENILIGNNTYNGVDVVKFAVPNSEEYGFYKHVATRDAILTLGNGRITAYDGGSVEIANGNTITITKTNAGAYTVNFSDFSRNTSALDSGSVINSSKILTLNAGDKVHVEMLCTYPINENTKTCTVNILKAGAQSVGGDNNLFAGEHVTKPDDYTRVYDITLASSFDVGAIFCSMQTLFTPTNAVLTFKLVVNGMQWI